MLLEDYKKINSSFKRHCVYRIGNEAGFFSEINNMLMAMVFCLENKLQFRLYSANSNFGEDIWKDYLIPFTKHSTSKSHALFNERPYIHKRPYPLDVNELFSIKKRLSREFLTQDIWPYIRNKEFYNVDYMVDSPYIKGNLTLVISVLIKCVWNYNKFAKQQISQLIRELEAPEKYAAIFVRRGDKYFEAPLQEIRKYINKVDALTNSKDFPLFISSDDYQIIEEAKVLFPERNIIHFNFEGDKGYFMEDFKSNYSKAQQKAKIVQLLAQVEILKNATYFVGTYSTNVGVFVGMARNCQHSYDINDEKWLLW
ncbi:hypothetical protein [Pedobacter panaciterrae]|uniref:hypothetical protein n=1 Tax=Pedobacter panaciterrae TaxID=363849 RepID=UPI002591BED3|nr:hypothetical protein [uncultured Pedobacter sp.]